MKSTKSSGSEMKTAKLRREPAKPPASEKAKRSNTLYFRDGKKRIDYILVYKESSTNDPELSGQQSLERGLFERNLRRSGIDLEHELATASHDGETAFVKLHGTWNFFLSQAEALRIRMPVKNMESRSYKKTDDWFTSLVGRCFKRNPLKLTHKGLPSEEHCVTAPFDRRYLDKFIMESEDTFFTDAQRNRMVWQCLMRTKSLGNQGAGINRLMSNSTYTAAYPLHEELRDSESKKNEPCSDRQLLCDVWASPWMFYKEQPFNLIRKYFGEKVTLYFAWLDYYTKALIPASVAGILCMIYGWSSLSADHISEDVCDTTPGGFGDTIMCPTGPIATTGVWNLSSRCAMTKATHVFDNIGTVLFALFMAFWSRLFVDCWIRKERILAWDWAVREAHIEEESVRPEYENDLKWRKMDPDTGEFQPYIPTSERILRLSGSITAVLLFFGLVAALSYGIVVFRVVVRTHLEGNDIHGADAIVLTALTGALLNLLAVFVLDYAYHVLAWYLTMWEMPRTEQQFEHSYTVKAFFLQFFSYFSTLCYVAFFKGRLISVKLDENYIGSYVAACDPTGCMVELSMLLIITAAGKQLYDTFMEILYPFFRNKLRRWFRKPSKSANVNSRWEQDYHLNEWPPLGIFGEYLEMVLQFGFVTLLVPAFPLIPFLALINNILEIRSDAYKILVVHRRPFGARARDLGVWNKILELIGNLAVFTNASVVAFTSDYIPRVLYKYSISKDWNYEGYVNFTLSWYDTRPSCAKRPDQEAWTACDAPYCRYLGFRTTPCALSELGIPVELNCDPADDYAYTEWWWRVLLGRAVFAVVFQNFVIITCKFLVPLLLPHVPSNVEKAMKQEREFEKDLCGMSGRYRDQ